MTRTLRIDMNELEEAVEIRGGPFSYVLDTETGRCITLPGDDYDLDIDEEMQDAIDLVEEAPAGRFLELSPDDVRLSLNDAREFADTVADEAFRKRLREALAMRRGAFHAFRDVLHQEAGERERWFHFQRQRLRKNIVEFLEEEGITAIYEPLPPYEPQLKERQHLLEGAAKFVDRAKQIRGVVRIALIGSLTTAKAQPNGIELLVTIESADVVPALAAAARKLSGHAQTMNRGADVFLANTAGAYLGRTCWWRECGPGIHRLCEAQHCGRHLNDDLHIVQLPKDLIASPPLVLWPKPIGGGDVPADTLAAFGIRR
ncbi:MAG TPA: UPF0158 family protein [Thermoanaerobaculia bacterium]|jgi:hypothetical protein|nr:UPF0158 family protein [Thermoanaerobaculia bacterium]